MDSYQTKKEWEVLYLDGYKREYAITIKLCSTRLIIRLEGTSGFTKAREAENLVNLILLIQGICFHFNDQHAYLVDSESHLHIPVQEQASNEFDSHFDMPKLIYGFLGQVILAPT